MIPARKMMDVHALCFVMNRVATTNWLHSAFAHCTLLEMFDVTSLWVIVEESVASTSVRPVENSPPHRARHAFHRADSGCFPLVSL